MANTLTWLHLSDLHCYRPKTGWDARRVIATFGKDLKKMETQHGLVPDLIFFTGDAAFGQTGPEPGKRISDQFNEAQDFIEGVRTSFSKEIPITNVFLVPGNHDINRTSVSEADTSWLKGVSDIGTINSMIQDAGRQWQSLSDRLHEYREFLVKLDCDHLLLDSSRLIYGLQRTLSGVPIQ